MSKTSSPAATPRNTTTSRNLKIRTAIKVGVINNHMHERCQRALRGVTEEGDGSLPA
jgi:hypothetical protein